MSTAMPTRTADATDVRTLRNYVGGQFVEAATNEHLDVTEPATGALLARVPLVSLAYSEKCSLLLSELLGLDPSVGPLKWVTDPEHCQSYLEDSGSAVTLDDAQWQNARSLATQATVRGLSAII